MSTSEQDIRRAFKDLPEPDLVVPAGLVGRLHRKQVRRQRIVAAVLAGGAACAVALSITGAAMEARSAGGTTDRLAGSSVADPAPWTQPAPHVSSEPSSLRAVDLPQWWYTYGPLSSGGAGGSQSIVSVQAYSYAGSPAFVVADLVRAGQKRVGLADYRTADLVLGEGLTSSGGVEATDRPLVGPTLLQTPAWPATSSTLWVWTHLPAGAASIRYQHSRTPARTADVLGEVGAITVPRLSHTDEPGVLTALSASGQVLLSAPAPWMQ